MARIYTWLALVVLSWAFVIGVAAALYRTIQLIATAVGG